LVHFIDILCGAKVIFTFMLFTTMIQRIYME
jgi:hypothetical protein